MPYYARTGGWEAPHEGQFAIWNSRLDYEAGRGPDADVRVDDDMLYVWDIVAGHYTLLHGYTEEQEQAIREAVSAAEVVLS